MSGACKCVHIRVRPGAYVGVYNSINNQGAGWISGANATPGPLQWYCQCIPAIMPNVPQNSAQH